MTTTTSTTSTAASAVSTATKSLLDSLGSGSGVDTGSLVTSLVQAQFAAKTATLTRKAETLTAQISGVSTVKSAITGFSTALETLAKGGTLTTQPKSSTAGVLSASALPGAALSGLQSSIAVTRLAGAQVAASTKVTTPDPNGGDPVKAGRGTVLGSGTFTIALGTATYAGDGKSITGFDPSAAAADRVSFDLTDATLDGIAAAINAKAGALGVAASVVTGADGSAYLSMKGATGSAKAFTMAVTGTGSDNLQQLGVGQNGGMAIAAAAQNAALSVDGVAVERASNTVDDLIPGVKLQLTTTGTTTLTASRPAEGLTQAVGDVVDTYNQVMALVAEQTKAVGGNLASDSAAQALLRNLKGMTLAVINPNAKPGEPRTLAELGVKTARDGTLSVDSKQLAKTLADYPDAVEAMFASSAASTTGLPARLAALSSSAASTTAGLGASNARYLKAQADIASAQAKVTVDSDAMTTRLTSQFAAMNSRVSAYKSIQGFMTNQIAAWNKSDS